MSSEQNIPSAEPLDDIDKTIVEHLRADGRLSIPVLAERVGIGRATAYARFDRLVETGVIKGFEAQVDPETLGLGVAALVTIESDQVAWAELRDGLLAIDGVHWVGLTAGTSDFVCLVRAADLDHLRDVVLSELLSVPGIRNTQTAVLLEEGRVPGGLV